MGPLGRGVSERTAGRPGQPRKESRSAPSVASAGGRDVGGGDSHRSGGCSRREPIANRRRIPHDTSRIEEEHEEARRIVGRRRRLRAGADRALGCGYQEHCLDGCAVVWSGGAEAGRQDGGRARLVQRHPHRHHAQVEVDLCEADWAGDRRAHPLGSQGKGWERPDSALRRNPGMQERPDRHRDDHQG